VGPDGPKESCVRWVSSNTEGCCHGKLETNFGKQFAITGFVGYNFGCMIGSDTLFDSRGGFSGSSCPMRT